MAELNNINDITDNELKLLKQGKDLSFINIFSDEPDRKNINIICEGDSWFDYPPGVDILDWLRLYYKYNIISFAKMGDRLRNIVYGNEPGTKKANIEVIKENIVKYNSSIVLLSAGGNDFAGQQIEVFLEYNKALKQDILDCFMSSLKDSIVYFIEELLKVNPNIKILQHGYAYAIPDGKPVLKLFGGLNLIGPWLKPAFDNMGFGIEEGGYVIIAIINTFNKILKGLQEEYKGTFYHVDLRDCIKDNDWVNELHLYNDAYFKVSKIFHQKIQECLPVF